MQEVTSTWVARHRAAAARLAARKPVLVRHHERNNVMILDERLAEEFFAWLAGRPADALTATTVGDDVMAEARVVTQEGETKLDRDLVELLEAKFGIRWPRH